MHPAQNETLPLQRILRSSRPLRQRREISGLRDRQLLRRASEISIARARDPDRLLTVRREIQIQREDFPLVVSMFETQSDQRFADFRAHRPRGRWQHQLRHLLGDRRSPFNHVHVTHVLAQRADHRDRIDSDVAIKPSILGGDRCARDILRNHRDPSAA